MRIIHTRRMATSQPRNFRRGLPLIPLSNRGHTINTPALTQDVGGGTPDQEPFITDLINTSLPFANWRFSAHVNVTVFTGSFSGLNIEYDVSGVTQNDGGGFIGLFNDRSAAGIAFGVSFNLEGQVVLERRAGSRPARNLPTGLSWEPVWEEALNRAFSFNIDAINLALTVLRIATGGTLPIELVQGARTVGSVGAMWGLFDERRDQMVQGGRIAYRPTIAFSPNLLTVIPEMRAVLSAFRKVGLQLSMGPTLNVVYPINFEVVRLITEDGAYGIGARTHVVTLVNGPRQQGSGPVSDVTIVHSHTINLRFELGLHFSFSFLGMFRVDETQVIPIPGIGSGPGLLGPFFTALNNSNLVAAAETEMPEVVWG